MKQEIELRHLRYFLAVAETLHFSKAAAHLGMAQPPLSQQIRSLERILGYPLFDRTTRGVRLTRVGQYFRERARNTLTKIHDDVEMARRLGSGQEGVLTVGFSGSVMLTTLPKAIERYRRRVGLLLTAFGSCSYHLSPNNSRAVTGQAADDDRFMSMVAAIIAERRPSGRVW